MAKIGFIGTGIMGKPMAINLQKAGHQIFLSQHHDQAPAELTEAGAIGLANPQEVAQEAEFIIVMVPDTRRSTTCCSVPMAWPPASAPARW